MSRKNPPYNKSNYNVSNQYQVELNRDESITNRALPRRFIKQDELNPVEFITSRENTPSCLHQIEF